MATFAEEQKWVLGREIGLLELIDLEEFTDMINRISIQFLKSSILKSAETTIPLGLWTEEAV